MSIVYLSVHRSNGGGSLVAQGHQWVDLRGVPSGEEAGGETYRYDNGHDSGECPRIGDRYTPNLAGEESCQAVTGKETNDNSYREQRRPFRENHLQDTRLLRAQRRADTDFVS